MKHLLLLPILLLLFSSAVRAKYTPGPVEQKASANICYCIEKLDMQNINEKAVA